MDEKVGIYKLNDRIKNIGMFISCTALFLMMCLIVVDIISRNIFNSPIAGSYEYVQNYFMPLIFFPAVAFTYNSGIMPQLNELVTKFPVFFQRIAVYLAFVLELILFGLLTYYGFKFAMQGFIDKMAFPVGGNLIPIYPLYFLIPIGFGVTILDIALSGMNNIRKFNESLLSKDKVEKGK